MLKGDDAEIPSFSNDMVGTKTPVIAASYENIFISLAKTESSIKFQ